MAKEVEQAVEERAVSEEEVAAQKSEVGSKTKTKTGKETGQMEILLVMSLRRMIRPNSERKVDDLHYDVLQPSISSHMAVVVCSRCQVLTRSFLFTSQGWGSCGSSSSVRIRTMNSISVKWK